MKTCQESSPAKKWLHYDALQFPEITNLTSVQLILTNVRMKYLSRHIFYLKQQLVRQNRLRRFDSDKCQWGRCMAQLWRKLALSYGKIARLSLLDPGSIVKRYNVDKYRSYARSQIGALNKVNSKVIELIWFGQRCAMHLPHWHLSESNHRNRFWCTNCCLREKIYLDKYFIVTFVRINWTLVR